MENDPERPKTIDEMREAVALWIHMRPTLMLTRKSLTKIFTDEVEELNEAVGNGEPQKHITLEVGDVLFSALALEPHENDKTIFLPLFDQIKRYCRAQSVSFPHLFYQTLYKNEQNYPFGLFNEVTPFSKKEDAVRCLRVFRTLYITPEKLDKFWTSFNRSMVDEPFFDGWVWTGALRKHIKTGLQEAAIKAGEGSAVAIEVADLIRIGVWGIKPLKIPGNIMDWSSH